MRLGLYTVAALLLMVVVGAVVYTLNAEYYLLEFMGINFNLPVAVWVVIPMVILFVFTFLHLLVYGLKSHFLLNKWKKDAQSLDDALYWSLLGEPKEQKYAIEETGKSAALLACSSLNVNDHLADLNPRLSKIVTILQRINNGEYVDLKEQKLAKVLTEGNHHLIQNRLNRLDVDEKFVEEVMKSSSEFSKEVQAKALKIFASKSTFSQARQYAKIFDIENLLVMLNRVSESSNIGLTQEALKDLLDAMQLTCTDFIRIAEITKKYFAPDENLAMFRAYQIKNDNAEYAYLYLLFEYEMMDEIGKYLEEHEDHEFMRFRALYTLKKANAPYKLEDIIDINTVCNEAKDI